MLDLAVLPTFVVFAETLSHTETGRRLGLTQPAVHGQIRRLAESVGEDLYVRTGRVLALTPRGEALAALGRDVLQRCAAFQTGGSLVRLAAGRGAWSHVLLEPLGTWIRQEGIVPVVADGAEAERAVLEGRAELGVSTRPDPERFGVLPIRTVSTVVVAPPGSVLPSPCRLESLDGRSWVMPSAGRPHRVVLEALLARAGAGFTVAAESDDWTVTVRWVELGLGVAAINDCIPSPGLPRAPLEDGPVQTYSLFWRRDRRPEALAALT
ncbi:MAG: LysR family transcriptional regulator [Alphaproteobacteria bacterium]|nr:LysR family transcriptional regulator [Alphaproteobacteria bacterium]